ncbi:MAG: hypothetical protein DLM59_07745 [Pseudonocardiales bacterium]|nr:MAG: hypothetical protein DLM59_07745 [Pseudonocardiales bacterium]
MLPIAQRIAVALTLVAVVALAGGCGSLGRSLSHRELVVIFVTDHTAADVARVRTACDGVAGAKALPAGPDNAVDRRYPLRFDITGLDLKRRSTLVGCLSGDPAVRGYTDSESTSGS